MKNCITTKLKEPVTGKGFFKANELVFKLIATENTWLWWLSEFSDVTTATLEGGAYFVPSEGSTENQGTSKQVGGNGVSIFVPKGEHYLKIADKTKVTVLGNANYNTYTFENFISSTSSSFTVELYGETLKYATNIHTIVLTSPYYRFFDLGSILKNKTLRRVFITAEKTLNGTLRELLEGAGQIEALGLENQTTLTGDTSVLAGVEIKELILKNNIFDIDLNNLYAIKGSQIMLYHHKGKIRGNVLNLNDDVACVSFLGSNDVILDNNNLFTNRSRIISGENLRFNNSSDVDNFLITNANKTAYPNLNSLPAWFKNIQIVGNRTSASDNAVNTLVSKGYTVSLIS